MRTSPTLRYAKDARADLERIIEYGLEQRFPDPPGFVLSLGQRIATLRDTPRQGRVGRVAATRELVLPGTPFIVGYTLHSRNVTVLRVLNGAPGINCFIMPPPVRPPTLMVV